MCGQGLQCSAVQGVRRTWAQFAEVLEVKGAAKETGVQLAPHEEVVHGVAAVAPVCQGGARGERGQVQVHRQRQGDGDCSGGNLGVVLRKPREGGDIQVQGNEHGHGDAERREGWARGAGAGGCRVRRGALRNLSALTVDGVLELGAVREGGALHPLSRRDVVQDALEQQPPQHDGERCGVKAVAHFLPGRAPGQVWPLAAPVGHRQQPDEERQGGADEDGAHWPSKLEVGRLCRRLALG